MTKKRIAIVVAALLIFSMLPGLALGTQVQVSLELNKSIAVVGDSITATGNADPGEWISIKVVDSFGSVVFYDAFKSGSNSTYSYTFKVPQVSPGILTVVAGYGENVVAKSLEIVSTNYTLALSDEGLSSDPAAGAIAENTPVTITIAPPEGKHVATFTVNGVDKKAELTGTPLQYTFTITANTTIEVTYADTKLVSIEITALQTKTIYVVGEGINLTGLVVTGHYNDGSSRVETITADNISGFDSSKAAESQTLTVTVGDKTTTYTVTITESITATAGSTVEISDTPVTITVPDKVDAKIAVDQNKPLPTVNIESTQVDITIPQGTQVSGSDTIKLPEVVVSPSVPVHEAQAVDLVIKVGTDSGIITFINKPVRIVLKEQAAKSAGFIDNHGNFKKITKLPSLNGLTSDADADKAGHKLSEEGVQEGAVVSGNDLIIWTTHFTEFIAYTPKPVDECFIATAAFGSKFEPAVVLLRAFRDTFLLTNAPGTAFVDFYYQNSPPIASYIANSGFLKAGVRALLTPVVGVVYLLFHPVLMYGIIGLLVFGIVIYRVRRRRVVSSC
jgi:hypothetical protein